MYSIDTFVELIILALVIACMVVSYRTGYKNGMNNKTKKVCKTKAHFIDAD